MTKKRPQETLPMPTKLLEEIATYYAVTDTTELMENGHWVDPAPMATTSLRLPADVVDRLKQQAAARNVRYTTYLRSILERVSQNDQPISLEEISVRLERVEAALGQNGKTKKAA